MGPLHQQLVDLLADLEPDAWLTLTVAGSWQVRDVAAHLLDGQLRSLSALRDGHLPPSTSPIESYRDLVGFLNQLNADWIQASRRLSPEVLVDLLTHIGSQAANLFTQLEPMAPARFPVGWAGESTSPNWMHVGREYTEWWHHQMQIRTALNDPSLLLEPRWLEPLLDFSMRALPHAYRQVAGDPGATLVVQIGTNRQIDPEPPVVSANGVSWAWSLVREAQGWTLWRGQASNPRTILSLDPETAWQSLFHALSPEEAQKRARINGDTSFAEPFFQTRSVMV